MLVSSRISYATETYVLETQRRAGFSPLKLLLWFLSLGYRAGVKVRNALYDSGVLRAKRAPLPVVSVGSVLAGGAGKTPLLAMLIEALPGKVAIISRGYRSESGKVPRQVQVSDRSDEVGDEPLLLKRRFPDTIVVVAKNRRDGVRYAHELGAQMAILDDGMQHRKLHRDLELAIVDNTCSHTWYLPRGLLRDEPKRLKGVDFLFYRGSGKPGGIEIDLEIEAFENSAGERFSGNRVGLFCTIARPYRFIESVERCGLKVENKWLLPDHCPIDEDRLAEFVNECKREGVDGLVCTEKDWVKLSREALELPIYYAKARMRIKEGHGHFDRLIAQMTEMI